jgi:hypothetical protein
VLSKIYDSVQFLQLALWNANSLTQHAEEIKIFISIHNTDDMLISETHFTEKNYLKLPNYAVYQNLTGPVI